MGKLLTLAIPTYNRVEKLKMCLEQVIEQTRGKSVELLVSDNASTDGTQQFMEGYCREHPNITYVRNAENIGPDRNFLNCYGKASGEYVILLGDDDLLLPGAVDAILEALARKPVFVHLNSCTLLSQEPLNCTPPRVEEGEMRIYCKREEIMEQMGIFVTFLSSFVLRTDLVRQIEDPEQYIGTYFIQSHIAIATLAAEGEYIYITKNCIAATGNETVRYDIYFVWGKMYQKLLMETGVSAGIDPQLLRRIHLHDLHDQVYWFVKYYRASCPQSKKWDKKAILDVVKPYRKLYIRYWATVYLPLPIVDAAQKCKRGVKRLLGR